MSRSRIPAARLEDMVVFARAVEAGSLSKAAKELGITRSGASKAVARLETLLETRLLHRTTRELGVTAAGQSCYAHCARIVAEVDSIGRLGARPGSAPHGPLRVACSLSVGIWLAPKLPAFLVQHPNVALTLRLSEEMIDLVQEGVDVGVRLGQLPDSSLVAKKLVRYRRMIVASPTYVAAHGAPTTPEELARHNCLVRIGHEQWKFKAGRDPIAVTVSGNYCADAPEILRQAARAGVGLAMLPSYVVAADLADGELVEVLPAYTADPLAIYAVYPNARHLPVNVRAFVAFLTEALAPIAA